MINILNQTYILSLRNKHDYLCSYYYVTGWSLYYKCRNELNTDSTRQKAVWKTRKLNITILVKSKLRKVRWPPSFEQRATLAPTRDCGHTLGTRGSLHALLHRSGRAHTLNHILRRQPRVVRAVLLDTWTNKIHIIQ